jgi:hybrid cluster-associated redox disulfide protein
MTTQLPTSDMAVGDVLENWPETVPVFQELKMACVGCAMAPFDTLDDVATIYKVDLSQFIDALYQAINSGGQEHDGG